MKRLELLKNFIQRDQEGKATIAIKKDSFRFIEAKYQDFAHYPDEDKNYTCEELLIFLKNDRSNLQLLNEEAAEQENSCSGIELKNYELKNWVTFTTEEIQLVFIN